MKLFFRLSIEAHDRVSHNYYFRDGARLNLGDGLILTKALSEALQEFVLNTERKVLICEKKYMYHYHLMGSPMNLDLNLNFCSEIKAC